MAASQQEMQEVKGLLADLGTKLAQHLAGVDQRFELLEQCVSEVKALAAQIETVAGVADRAVTAAQSVAAAIPQETHIAPSAQHLRSALRLTAPKLSYDKATGALNRNLELWAADMKGYLDMNGITGDAAMAQAAVQGGTEGHVRDVCLLQRNSDPTFPTSWDALMGHLQSHFAEHDRTQAACRQLHTLAQKDDSARALETFVSRSKELHIQAGSQMGEPERFRWFMQGMRPNLRQTLRAAMASMDAAQGTKIPETFAVVSKMALDTAARQDVDRPRPSGRQDGHMPMEMAAAMMHQQGWAPRGGGSGNRTGSGRGRSAGGRPTGGRNRNPNPGKGTWTPNLSYAERRALLADGKCLCCKRQVTHTWRGCPRNPDSGSGNL